MKTSDKDKIPDIKCLGIKCGKIIELPQYIDPERYDGDVRCQGCGSLMRIKLDGSKVIKHRLVEDNSREAAAQQTMAELNAALEKPDNEVN